ncbi:MAG: hypothetical protein KDD53_00610 [Bdellovibrionales bacterium]|nr:hypothetical protein [Bdellovibrionales bacterium]
MAMFIFSYLKDENCDNFRPENTPPPAVHNMSLQLSEYRFRAYGAHLRNYMLELRCLNYMAVTAMFSNVVCGKVRSFAFRTP